MSVSSSVSPPIDVAGEAGSFVSGRLGAVVNADGSCSFGVWAPRAQRVTVLLQRDSQPERVELSAGERGYHHARVENAPAGTRYAYLLDDDDLELPDPASGSQPDGVHGASEVVDHAAFQWSDDSWRGVQLRDYVLYELHVGTFTPEGTFEAIIPRLRTLANDGVTAIELLPVAEFPGSRNWGYDGVSLFAPHSAYGGPDGLRRLVDAAHGVGIAVVLDVVYNHLGPEGNYLGRFGDYFTDRHTTPWGSAVNVDDYGSDEVRRFFTENALGWLRDFHIDALRLDAIHGIVDTTAIPFLAQLADAVADLSDDLGRPAYLISESDLNDVRVITPRADGGLGHHTQWTDDFHHSLRVALTGERDGYYADYDGLEDLARSYGHGFVYDGRYSLHRGRRHGSVSSGFPGERFVVYAQNHDQVGNRLLGDRLAASISAEQQRIAMAAVLLAPFVPMLFMGEEYAETAPFPYFVSHTDEALVAAVRAGRKREFAWFGIKGDAPDPQGIETFRSAVLGWDERESGGHGQHLAWTRELLRLRRGSPSIGQLSPADTRVRLDADRGLLVLERGSDPSETTVVALAFGEEPLPLDALGVENAADWERLLDSRDSRFGGSGVDEHTIGARSAAVFRRVTAAQRG